MIVYTIHVDASEVMDSLQEIDDPHELTPYLQGALGRVFMTSQSSVHVLTGSLKLSGRSTGGWSGDDWHGEITYGGPSAGVNNPVEYAFYEWRRGGSHDFFGAAKQMDGVFSDAIVDFFGG